MKTYVRVNGRRVAAYDEVGTGPPLVCIPGGPGYAGDQVLDLGGLAHSRTLIRLDLRGAGESDAPECPTWSLADYAADLDVVRQHLGLDAMDIFGHAHGGLVAAVYGTSHPEHVNHAVLDGVPARPVHEFDGETEGGVAGYFIDYDARAQDYVRTYLGRMNDGAMAWFWDHEAGVNFPDLLAAVRVPTLVVTGEADPMGGRRAVEKVAARMLQGRSAVIEGASHFAWVEQPEAFAAAVESFLSAGLRV